MTSKRNISICVRAVEKWINAGNQRVKDGAEKDNMPEYGPVKASLSLATSAGSVLTAAVQNTQPGGPGAGVGVRAMPSHKQSHDARQPSLAQRADTTIHGQTITRQQFVLNNKSIYEKVTKGEYGANVSAEIASTGDPLNIHIKTSAGAQLLTRTLPPHSNQSRVSANPLSAL
jgi:hypothetical protein